MAAAAAAAGPSRVEAALTGSLSRQHRPPAALPSLGQGSECWPTRVGASVAAGLRTCRFESMVDSVREAAAEHSC